MLENFTWERKSAAMLAKSIHDPIACFCATIDGTVHVSISLCVCNVTLLRFQISEALYSIVMYSFFLIVIAGVCMLGCNC